MSTATIVGPAIATDLVATKALFETLAVVTADRVGSYVIGQSIFFWKTTTN